MTRVSIIFEPTCQTFKLYLIPPAKGGSNSMQVLAEHHKVRNCIRISIIIPNSYCCTHRPRMRRPGSNVLKILCAWDIGGAKYLCGVWSKDMERSGSAKRRVAAALVTFLVIVQVLLSYSTATADHERSRWQRPPFPRPGQCPRRLGC